MLQRKTKTDMLHNLRLAIRQLVAAPGYCLAVILTLALGIGVNTAVFTLLNGFLVRPLPYAQPERIAGLAVHTEGLNPRTGKAGSEEDNSFDGESWILLRQNVPTLTFASFGGSSGANLKSDADGAVRYVKASRVSANYFEVLGIPLSHGRAFTAEEDRPHGPPAVILSYALWQSTFGGDRQIVGKAIHLKGEPYNVVGVLPRNAVTPSHADLFTPLQPSTTGECGGPNCGIFVRLKKNATWQQVDAQLSRLRLHYFNDLEKGVHGKAWLYARPLQADLSADMRDKVTVLMLSVLFILLIACANLAGLALVRLSRREQEIATRLALGAGRWQIVRQLWTENFLLALLGGVAGLASASVVVRVATHLLPDQMLPLEALSVDPAVFAFAAVVSLLTSFLFGALPALKARNVDLRSSLASGSRTLATGSSRLRQFLIVGEVALTIVLLAASGLMVRTLLHLEMQPPGFDPHNVITAKVSLDDARYRDPKAFHALLSQSITTLRDIPGVKHAAFALSVPYERGLNDGFTLLDGPLAGKRRNSSLTYVTDGFFSTLRIPLLAGRSLKETDTPNSQFVVIVNGSFSRRFFQNPNAVGRHLRMGKSTYTIVGVVADVAKKPGIEPQEPVATEPLLYLPATQIEQGEVNVAHIWFEPSWIVRSDTSDLSTLSGQIQQVLKKVDPGLPLSGFSTMDQILQKQLQQQRIEVALLTTLSGLALLLSTIGIYALVSNLVVQRKREIGIRIALGSTTRQAMLHIGSSGISAALAGILFGVAASLFTVRVLASELYGVKLYDPFTLISVPLLLAGVAILASLLPTLRITRLQPAETLRAE